MSRAVWVRREGAGSLLFSPQAEKVFMVARGLVREAQEQLEVQQAKLKEVRGRLDRISKEDSQYLELATLEHRMLQVGPGEPSSPGQGPAGRPGRGQVGVRLVWWSGLGRSKPEAPWRDRAPGLLSPSPTSSQSTGWTCRARALAPDCQGGAPQGGRHIPRLANAKTARVGG